LHLVGDLLVVNLLVDSEDLLTTCGELVLLQRWTAVVLLCTTYYCYVVRLCRSLDDWRYNYYFQTTRRVDGFSRLIRIFIYNNFTTSIIDFNVTLNGRSCCSVDSTERTELARLAARCCCFWCWCLPAGNRRGRRLLAMYLYAAASIARISTTLYELAILHAPRLRQSCCPQQQGCECNFDLKCYAGDMRMLARVVDPA